MITCNLMGGLGNQIFQIFATISCAIKSKNQFKFLNVSTLGGGSSTIRNTFWNSFFNRLNVFLIDIIPQPIHVIREKDFTFNELPISEMVERDCLIYGYFQSYKYFHENYNTICRIIGLEKMKENLIQKLNLNEEYFNNCISMHFRIGDYKKIQAFHPLTTYEYYRNSLNCIKNKSSEFYNILYFCEDIDIDDVTQTINRLQSEFPDYKFIRGNNTLEDWEQMLLMSFCHHNIIANSSFSWWGAYFNSWPDKIICYPSVWFGEVANNNTKDLCPPDWNRISVN
jgi:hypothetical protein